MKQIKLFKFFDYKGLESTVNQFIKEQQDLSHEIVDIRYHYCMQDHSNYQHWTAMVIYETEEKVAE